MEKSYSDSYKAAGVDVTAGYRSVELIKKHVARTTIPGVLSGLGGFGGIFAPQLSGMKEPVLISGTDGVGTKLRLAFLMDKHDTIGIDCVAMCVNDIICGGGAPLFFLDYIAVGKNIPERVEQIVAGVAEGCVQSGCALIGGETAEMPGFYAEDEYDLVGFAVGIADREKILDSKNVRAGDVIVALPSSGVHSNGFSLVRKALRVEEKGRVDQYIAELGKTLGEDLLTPTQIYVKPILALLEQVNIHSLSHITGGGFYENIPRALPKGLGARVELAKVKTPPIFDVIAKEGKIPQRDMFNTFNMGVGMCAVVAPEDADKAVSILRANGVEAYPIGMVTAGESGVELA